MTLTRNIIMAMTSKRWINQPILYTPISPKSHNATNMIAIVVSIYFID